MNNSNESNIITLTGCVPVTVTDIHGKTETVAVRALPIKDFTTYLQSQANEPAMVALLCGKPESWAEQLDNASIEVVMAKGEEMNRDFFGRWAGRMARRAQFLNGTLPAQVPAQSQFPLPSGSPK